MPLISQQLFIKVAVQENTQEKHKQLVLNYGFTAREKEVVKCLLKGMTYKQCAAELYISQNTVKFHALNAYRKADVTSRGELMALFLDK
ncbi:MAG TPA: helix-turn-helix transcriptional regulator [Christensenellaceae bacterium]|nr:helix-turn-helix transcriptional regulator [Christensenellaceae bacterium]